MKKKKDTQLAFCDRKKEEKEKLLDRFQDPRDPLKFLIVTSKLLAGFDVPILQSMYLDKPTKEHNLLQAICCTNRPYPHKSRRSDRTVERRSYIYCAEEK